MFLCESFKVNAQVLKFLEILIFLSFNLMQFGPNFQSSFLDINKQRDMITFNYLKGIQDKLSVLPQIANNLSLLPQINANLSQMIELMHRMALSSAKTSIHGQDIVSTVEMVLKPAEKLKESFAEPPTDQNTIQVQEEEVSELKKKKFEPDKSEKHNKINNPPQQTKLLQKQSVQQSAKKSQYTKINDFPQCISVVPFDQNDIIVDFGDYIKKLGKFYPDLSNFKDSMSEWMGFLYNQIAQKSFSGYFSRYLNHEETKVFFTKNLIINFVRMIELIESEFKYVWKGNQVQLIGHFEDQSSKILEYIALKYPQQQRSYVSNEVRQAITAMDNSREPQYDYFCNSGEYFTLEESKLPVEKSLKKLKEFINKIITLTDSKRKQWKELMKEFFTVDGKELWNQASAKFKQNTPIYSPKQIEQYGIKIKTPQVLRVIVKWTEQLEKQYLGLTDGTFIKNKFAVTNGGQPTVLQTAALQKAQKIIQQNIKHADKTSAEQIKQDQQKIHQHIRSVISLFPGFLRKYSQNFNYLDPNSLKSGLLSFVLSSTASQLTVNYLLGLIEKLKVFEQLIFKGKSQYNFVSFKISDLLRSKCVGTLQQIKKVYQKISGNQKIQIYRIKNRIDTSNRDFLVNVKLKGTDMLCEIQLKILQQEGDQKQKYVSHFSHLLYQLSRAKYGPIGQAVMINTHLTEFVPFFKQRMPKISRSEDNLIEFKAKYSYDKKWEKQLILQNYIKLENNLYFICANCLRFKEAYSSFLSDYKYKISKNQKGNQYIICGQCALNRKAHVRIDYLSSKLQILSKFFTEVPFSQSDNQVDFENHSFLCIIDKNVPVFQKQIVQNVFGKKDKAGQTYSFLPVFWENFCERHKIISHMTKEELQNKYYIFILKENVQIISVNRIQLIKLCQNDVISLKNSALQPQIYLNRQNQNRKQLKEADAPSLHLKVGDVFDHLEKSESERALILFHPQIDDFFLMSDVTSQQKMQKFLNRKQLTQDVVESMKTAAHWELSDCGIRNQMLEIFQKIPLEVNRIDLKVNRCIEIPKLIANQLRKLILESNRLKFLKIQNNMFPKLELLNLKKNNIQTIIQVHHDKIEELYLNDNKIRKLNEKEWKVPKLKILNLQNNQIQTLNFSEFTHFNPDGRFILCSNPLQKVEFPKVVTYFQTLHLDKSLSVGMNISNVQFKNLIKIKIDDFILEKLSENKEQSLCKVQRVLQFVSISQQFPFLEELIINCCNTLESISSDWFNEKMPNLKIIKLHLLNSLKKIEFISPYFQHLTHFEIAKCPTLKEIILSQNFTELVSLDITDTGLTELNFSWYLPNLSSFSLCSNKLLQSIDLSNAHFPKLSNLTLLKNSISTIIWCKKLENIYQIQIRENKLKQIDFRKTVFTNLKNFICMNQEIEKIDFGSSVNQIKELVINETYLKSINLSTFSNLQQLRCSRNQLETVIIWPSICKLTTIDLSYNNLKTIDFSATDLSDLQYLNCQENQLQSIVFGQPLLSISYFDVSFNRLTQLDFSHTNQGPLGHFNCSFNFITDLLLSKDFNFQILNFFGINNNFLTKKFNSLLKERIASFNLDIRTDFFPLIPLQSIRWLLTLLSEEDFSIVLQQVQKLIGVKIFRRNGLKVEFINQQPKDQDQGLLANYCYLLIIKIMSKMGKLNREWNEGLLKMIMIIKRENAALETYEDFKNLNVEQIKSKIGHLIEDIEIGENTLQIKQDKQQNYQIATDNNVSQYIEQIAEMERNLISQFEEKKQ